MVIDNFEYKCANDITVFLSERFSHDFPTKRYYTVDPTMLRNNKNDFKIKNCMAQHMFFFFPDGQVQCKVNICSCNSCMEGKFVRCSIEMGQIVQYSLDGSDVGDDSDIEYELDDSPDCDSNDDEIRAADLRGDSVLGAIQKGNFIGLLSPHNSFEPFFLYLVKDFGKAEKALDDENHFIFPGEKYIECQYLDRDRKKKTRGKVHYKLLPDTVYVNPASVFAPCVNMDPDLSMSIEEYMWLCDSI